MRWTSGFTCGSSSFERLKIHGLADKGHHWFILPMSVRSWKFIIAGTPAMAGRSAFGR